MRQGSLIKSSWVLTFAVLCMAGGVSGQDPAPAPGSREATWPAPSAEDWSRPCLVKFQRSYADALAVSKETGKPVLICVNMDGEIASEHYAGIRYRDPEIAKIYEDYVCVLASVYRHTPRDFDENGQRILCPRFGSVTCGEHIAVEPGLYEKFFDGKRIAPRHVGVELDKSEMYDVYYANDTASVFDRLKKGIADRKNPVPPVVRGDRPITERVKSFDNQDRIAVESAYLKGDQAERKALLDAAESSLDTAPLDLLRLAVFGVDSELSKKARSILAKSESEAAVDLITEALRVPMDARERESLVSALGRLGGQSERARTLSVVHQGLTARSKLLDVDAWRERLEEPSDDDGEVSARSAMRLVRDPGSELPLVPGPDAEAISQMLAKRQAILESPDSGACVELTEALLAAAEDDATPEHLRGHFLHLALEAGARAERLGAYGFRLNAAMALAHRGLDQRDEAAKKAEMAVSAVPEVARTLTAARVLQLFAETRERAIRRAVREKAEWPREWLADVHSAYGIVAKHPGGTEAAVASHYDFLISLAALSPALRVLDDGLARFPESGVLHNRLRRRILRERGPEGLEATYSERVSREGDDPYLTWFAGYASRIAAEYHRRAKDVAKAIAAYDRSMAYFEKSIELRPEARESADREIAIVLGGKARLSFEAKQHENAVDLILASFQRQTEAAATLDGLNLSTVDTAKMVVAALKAEKATALHERLSKALRALPPKLLELPAFEREPGASPRDRQPRGGRPGG